MLDQALPDLVPARGALHGVRGLLLVAIANVVGMTALAAIHRWVDWKPDWADGVSADSVAVLWQVQATVSALALPLLIVVMERAPDLRYPMFRTRDVLLKTSRFGEVAALDITVLLLIGYVAVFATDAATTLVAFVMFVVSIVATSWSAILLLRSSLDEGDLQANGRQRLLHDVDRYFRADEHGRLLSAVLHQQLQARPRPLAATMFGDGLPAITARRSGVLVDVRLAPLHTLFNFRARDRRYEWKVPIGAHVGRGATILALGSSEPLDAMEARAAGDVAIVRRWHEAPAPSNLSWEFSKLRDSTVDALASGRPVDVQELLGIYLELGRIKARVRAATADVRAANPATWIQSVQVPEGVGLDWMGAHLGAFYEVGADPQHGREIVGLHRGLFATASGDSALTRILLDACTAGYRAASEPSVRREIVQLFATQLWHVYQRVGSGRRALDETERRQLLRTVVYPVAQICKAAWDERDGDGFAIVRDKLANLRLNSTEPDEQFWQAATAAVARVQSHIALGVERGRFEPAEATEFMRLPVALHWYPAAHAIASSLEGRSMFGDFGWEFEDVRRGELALVTGPPPAHGMLLHALLQIMWKHGGDMSAVPIDVVRWIHSMRAPVGKTDAAWQELREHPQRWAVAADVAPDEFARALELLTQGVYGTERPTQAAHRVLSRGQPLEL